MTREIIEDFRFTVIPYMVNRFKEINYEGQGGTDAKEFMSDFNEICDLAIKALEQEPTTKNDLGVDCISRAEVTELLRQYYHSKSFTDEQKKVIYELSKDLQYLIHSVEATPQEPILDKIYADIQKLRGCSCSCSDGIIDDVEDILDKYKAESEG